MEQETGIKFPCEECILLAICNSRVYDYKQFLKNETELMDIHKLSHQDLLIGRGLKKATIARMIGRCERLSVYIPIDSLHPSEIIAPVMPRYMPSSEEKKVIKEWILKVNTIIEFFGLGDSLDENHFSF